MSEKELLDPAISLFSVRMSKDEVLNVHGLKVLELFLPLLNGRSVSDAEGQ